MQPRLAVRLCNLRLAQVMTSGLSRWLQQRTLFSAISSSGLNQAAHRRSSASRFRNLRCDMVSSCVALREFQLSGLYANGPCGQNTASLGTFSDTMGKSSRYRRLAGKLRRFKEDRLQQQGVLNVRKPYLLAALAASVASIVLVTTYAPAQSPVRQPVRPAYNAAPIALVDISYIFKEHLRFKAKMEQMKADVERAEAEVKSQRTMIVRLAEQLRELRSGTPDYKSLEEEITKRQADLSVRVSLQKKEFLQSEAKIYHDTYQEVLYEVDHFAKAKGIAMVLRFNGDPVDTENPQSVLTYINKPVVWYSQDRDITKVVLDQLNQRGPATNPRVTNKPARPGVFPRAN